MKVLLVQSFLDGNKDAPIFPLGLSYLAAFLGSHDVRVFDPNLTADSIEEAIDSVINDIREFNPDVVGASLRNIDNQNPFEPLDYYGDFKRMTGVIKVNFPGVLIIAGGAGFSMFSLDIMEENPQLDYGVYLEAEHNFAALLGNLKTPQMVRGVYYRENGKVLFTGYPELVDFKDFPLPNRAVANVEKYKKHIVSVGVQTKRGCPLKCAYCNYPLLNGTIIRVRQAEKVVDEIEELIDRHGVDEFIFADSVFNLPANHAEEICDELIRREVKAKWICWLDIKHTTKDLLLLLVRAGCVGAAFSPDGLSTASLKALNKGITESDVWALMRLFAFSSGLNALEVHMSMFINTPSQTSFAMVRVVVYKLISHVIRLVLRRKFIVSFNWIRIEPNTELHKIAINERVIDKDTRLLQRNWRDIGNFFYHNPKVVTADSIIKKLSYFVRKIKRLLKRDRSNESASI